MAKDTKEKAPVPVEYDLRNPVDREKFRAEYVPKAPVLGPLFELVDELYSGKVISEQADRIEELERRIDADFEELQVYRKNTNVKETFREFLENLDLALEVKESRGEDFSREDLRAVDPWNAVKRLCRFEDELEEDAEEDA